MPQTVLLRPDLSPAFKGGSALAEELENSLQTTPR